MDGGSGDMTLAFDLAALKALARPDAVFSDARQWTEYVGVVSEKPTYVVTNFTRKHRIRQDFFSGPRGREESLENVREQFGTDRHVFVGTEDADADLAEATGWEYLDVEDAAEAADWTLASDEPPEAELSGRDDDEPRDDWPEAGPGDPGTAGPAGLVPVLDRGQQCRPASRRRFCQSLKRSS